MSYFTYQEKNIYFTMKGKGPLLIILPGNTASSAAHENEINYPEKIKAVVADSYALHFTEAMYTRNVLEGRSNPTEQQRMFRTAK